jgi:AP endonuclease-1
MNDSKAPFASHRDLHANIGTGFLGLRSFHNFVNDSRFEGLPLILETPLEAKDENGVPLKDDKGKPKSDEGIWAREIKLLESLVGMDAESEEFLELEKALAKKGESERKEMSEKMEKKREKEEKNASKPKKGKKKIETESEVEDSALSEMESDDEVNGDTQRIVG